MIVPGSKVKIVTTLTLQPEIVILVCGGAGDGAATA
jgi:hypothetical protein